MTHVGDAFGRECAISTRSCRTDGGRRFEVRRVFQEKRAENQPVFTLWHRRSGWSLYCSAAGHMETAMNVPAVARRVLSEFEEMPGMSLSLKQASRLFGLEEDVCRTVITALVDG